MRQRPSLTHTHVSGKAGSRYPLVVFGAQAGGGDGRSGSGTQSDEKFQTPSDFSVGTESVLDVIKIYIIYTVAAGRVAVKR